MVLLKKPSKALLRLLRALLWPSEAFMQVLKGFNKALQSLINPSFSFPGYKPSSFIFTTPLVRFGNILTGQRAGQGGSKSSPIFGPILEHLLAPKWSKNGPRTVPIFNHLWGPCVDFVSKVLELFGGLLGAVFGLPKLSWNALDPKNIEKPKFV